MFGLHFSRLGSVSRLGLVPKALAILRSYGTDAHIYLPGVGTISGLTAGNYLDSAGTTAATVDNPVGLVVDSLGAVNATQATTANKPILRRGLLNLLTYSDFQNGVSDAPTRGGLVTESTLAGYNGALAFGHDGSTTSYAYKPLAPTSGLVYTLAVVVKMDDGAAPVFDGGLASSNPAQTFAGIMFGGGVIATSATVQSDGTYLVLFNSTAPSSTSSSFGVVKYGTNNSRTFKVTRYCLIQGTYTAQQIVDAGGIPLTTSAAASNPSAGKYWWSFDGSNDSLLSGNLGITTACTIVIAGRLNSLATVQTLFAEDANGVQIYIDTSGIVTLVKFGVSLIVNTAAATIVAGVPFVVTVRLSGGTAVIRKNGVQVVTAATALAFSATTGARIGTNFDGTTQPAGGAIGWVVPLPAALSDADCLTVERLVAAQFPGLTTPDGDALALLLEDGSGFLTMETGDLLLLE